VTRVGGTAPPPIAGGEWKKMSNSIIGDPNSGQPASNGQPAGQPSTDQLIGLEGVGQNAAPAPSGSSTSGAASGAAIMDSSEAAFAQDVIEASMQVPVIVDFWAPWCGPCKQLTPALEKAVTAAGGKVKLVKIDIDQNPGIAQQLRIQSIPTIYAFAGGRPVDGFQGALPDSELQEFVNKLVDMAGQLGGEAGGEEDQTAVLDEALAQAEKAVEDGDHATAAAIFGQVLEHRPDNALLQAKLAVAYAKMGEIDAAQSVIDNLPQDTITKPEIAGFVASATAAIELASTASEAAGKIDALKAKVEANAKDHQARFDLAEAEAAMGNHEAAIDHLLDILMVNKEWNEGAARAQLLKVFEALGPTDPLVVSGRRRLSSLLFS